MRVSNGWKTSGKALPVSQALPVVMSIGIAHRPMILFILIVFHGCKVRFEEEVPESSGMEGSPCPVDERSDPKASLVSRYLPICLLAVWNNIKLHLGLKMIVRIFIQTALQHLEEH